MQTLPNEKQIVFKRWMTTQLYAQSNFHGQLKMTVNKKGCVSSSSSVFRKILLQSVAELPGQAENDRVKQFGSYI